MATISNPLLKIDPVPIKGNRRKVTLTYTLRFTPREEAAGTVFDETAVLMGDDPVFDDARAPLLSAFVKALPTNINRVVTVFVSSSRLDEDGDTIIFGVPILKLRDELFARITLTPFVPTAARADSNVVTGQFGPAA